MSNTNQPYFLTDFSHPGEILDEKLEELQMTSKQLAARTGKPEKTISAIINGNSAITPDMAVLLEQAVQIPANYWLRHQALHDEAVARATQAEQLKADLDWVKKFPIAEMIKFGWLEKVADKTKQLTNLLTFLGIGKPALFDTSKTAVFSSQFRISTKIAHSEYAVFAWLRKGELDAQKMKVVAYDKKAFELALKKCKQIAVKQPDNYFELLQAACAEAGVKVVFTPCLPKSPVNGATRWIGDSPLIQLSGRQKSNDVFWFTFFHEAAHILLHGKKDFFIEGIEYTPEQLAKENEANEFASNYLFSAAEQAELLQKTKLTIVDIVEFAEKIGTHPAFIVGRFQHLKTLNFAVGNQLKINLNPPL